MSQPKSTRLGRFVRGHRPDRNPLRRTVDRAETLVLALLVVAFLAAAPFAASAAGAWAYAAAHRDQVAQQADSRLVTAVLLTSVAMLAPGGGEQALQGEGLATWRAPDGTVVTGYVPAAPGTKAGTSVRVWSTRDGKPASPPLQASGVRALANLGTAAGVICLAAALTLTGLITRRVAARRRMAAWDADWRATGPRWTHHRA